VLALTAHFGNWELLTVSAALLDIPLGILYRPLDFKPIDRFFVNLRTRFGAKVIPQKRALREILRSLGGGEIIALLMDQNVDWYEGVFVDFMGRRACTNKGLALIALKSEAPVVPVFMVRRRNGFTTIFLPEIPLIKNGDKTRDIEENTAQYNKVIASFLHQYPEQWFWLHQRWKTRPYHPWPREIDHGNKTN
jgi:KDO2-lipid IV(A) lauroyltransferase